MAILDRSLVAHYDRQAGGNTPKSGLKNAEERRKELDRMRDEARARRAEDMVSSRGSRDCRY